MLRYAKRQEKNIEEKTMWIFWSIVKSLKL